MQDNSFDSRLPGFLEASSLLENISILKMSHWVIVGASRGIGLEFVKRLVARGDNVTATTRGDMSKASKLWSLAGSSDQGTCRLLECDVKSEASISVCLLQIHYFS